jgi:hypothetical protein
MYMRDISDEELGQHYFPIQKTDKMLHIYRKVLGRMYDA